MEIVFLYSAKEGVNRKRATPENVFDATGSTTRNKDFRLAD